MISKRRLIYAVPIVLVILSLACSLPGLSSDPTPTSGEPAATEVVSGIPEPTATPLPLPPALVESYPPPGSEIPLSQPITLYFNQPMDRSSVQGAISGQPVLSGSFTWESESSLTFIPDAPFLPETDLLISLGSSAQSQKGLALANPLTITYHTTGYVKLTQVLPAPGAQDVDPTSAVAASFNRPIVSIGADPSTLPAGFTITATNGETPAGRGEWTNTGTYIFYPEPGLVGGEEYTVMINTSLNGVDGAPLDAEDNPQAPLAWTFSTAVPRLVSIVPESGSTYVHLDPEIVLTFNQVMDEQSVEAAFVLLSPDSQAVQGTFEWSDDGRVVTFKPSALLAKGSQYQVFLSGTAQALGGTTLGLDVTQAFFTVFDLGIINSQPVPGGIWNPSAPIELFVSSVIGNDNLLDYVSISPEVANLNYYFDESFRILRLFGNFEADTDYTVTVSGGLEDAWGGTLGEDYILSFHTGNLDPSLYITTGTDVFFMTPQETGITVQATNLSEIPLSIGSVPLEDFILMAGFTGYDIRSTYQPADQVSWTQTISVTPNQSEAVDLPLSPSGSSLTPGLYYLRMNPLPGQIFAGPYLAVVSNLNITFKLSQTDTLVWAVDLRTGEPVAEAPVSIYDENGNLHVEGFTDASGLFAAPVGPFQDSYSPRYAVIGEPGQDTFGLAVSTWSNGLEPYQFGFRTDYEVPGLKTYLYTDRPIYRPGQTVHFRAVVRDVENGRYSLPEITTLALMLYDDMGQVVSSFNLPVSTFGTAAGEFELPEDARPGFYRLGDYPNELSFAVAEYRKPEINLAVSFVDDQVLTGQALEAEVNARYFFDAPASNVPVQWSLYEMETNFAIPGYSVGESDLQFMDIQGNFVPELGTLIDSGEAITGPDGLLQLTLTPPDDGTSGRRLYTLEVTLTDETGLPVSARGQVISNPAPFYIGLKPNQWFGRAGTSILFDVQVSAWDGTTGGERSLEATFRKVTWEQDADNVDLFGLPIYTPQYEFAGSADFITGTDGRAVLSFTPTEPGTYELKVSGGGTASSVVLWVGGEGNAIWPELPNQRLTITAGKVSYVPGETANLFIPNPFGSEALALVSVERGEVMRADVMRVPEAGLEYNLPLSLEDAPNVYVAVTLIGQTPDGQPDFRQGYTELIVDPAQLELNVQLTVSPEKAGPGDDVTIHLRVSDSIGNPIQAEFSLAVVDLAALALADPNSVDIRTAFYGEQPIAVRTAFDLAVSTRRLVYNPGGLGGGGGAGVEAVARENFPDTAYWNPLVITDENGEAEIALTLPDSLTTWQVDARGLTASTQVGEDSENLITSKELLVRPVTPRFLVAGDRVLLSSVVQNTTASDMDVVVSLVASGVQIDNGSLTEQRVTIPANGRARVEWWVRVEDVESVDLVFAASAGSYQDASRPYNGQLPVIGYTAPQAFATAGILDGSQEGGGLERLELISLPGSFDPQRGELRLELAPSLGAALLQVLDALEYSSSESTEQLLSQFLPNLEAYRALNDMGIVSPDLQARLDRTLHSGLSRLISRQNDDGGWGWWSRADSDAYISAYVLYGLGRCKEADIQVDQSVIDQAIAYLAFNLPSPSDSLSGVELDRLAFEVFTLAEHEQLDPVLPYTLFELRDRLSPWAQALLALTLDQIYPGDERVTTLLSDIQSLAVRTGSSVHWEEREVSWFNNSSPVTGSAIVILTLAKLEPASTLIPEAVRYLMAHRAPRGGWSSTYETAWATMAVVEVMKGTGEWTGEYAFEASLNGAPFASGQAAGAAGDATPVSAAAALDKLYADSPNALVISREPGTGRLYYTAHLDVYQPVETVGAVNRGIVVDRSYYARECSDVDCQAISSAAAGQSLQVRVTVNVANDVYNLVVEDYIPAGAEILDTSLLTTQLGDQIPLDLSNPARNGWGWWNFNSPRIYDDHISWTSSYLPAGTYELTYTLVLLQPGEFRVIPARAWQLYFPEVQGNSAGAVFEILNEVIP